MLTLSLLPEGMSLLAFASLALTSFAGSFITVAFGIGGGALMLAVMATLLPPTALIPVHGVIQIGSNLGRVMVTFRHIFWPALPSFAVGSLIGAATGGMVAVNLPPALVQIGVGLFILWNVLAKAPRILRDWPLVIGVLSSFLTMFFGATGIFVATYIKSLELPRHGHVATQAALMSLQHGLKVIVFGLLGFAFWEWAGFIAVMIATGFCGTLTGKAVLNRMGDDRFRLALNIVLIALAARLVYAGLRDLTGL
ncbi:hypothetical protein ROLI_041130 [Roseobacter fucihabitans]|uniref:Probable membrane transporter protein n=1 Tax=Roseobacter fucihabitans TaxID=1537242 RepID=A0ABZ2C104_9RHOB|nr:sulfite exporter TauE/SafE family protein [Roseobacter litoralis]MBC6965107.1 Sulfite exporter TauE/SafE [Roseobacter litoralis]MBC6965890.1 Sulfite exporter TauE/SafE [Roseobacter litoralis]